MLPTLQKYILSDLGKTFLLTVIGLTAVLGLGGGVMNLIELEEVTPSQLLKLMLIVLPVAGTLTLPIAALYSATVTYGRLSADNELLACRSSGINIHVLFLPCLAVSLLSSLGTFVFICFMIPGLIQNLNSFVRGDLRQFIQQRVDSPGRLSLPGGRVRIYADGSSTDPDDPNSIVLDHVAFVAMGADSWSRYGTAESCVIRFATDQGEPTIAGELNNMSYYDRSRGWATSKYQSIPPNRIPLHIRPKVKWLDLGDLLRYRSNPGGWPRVADALQRFRQAIVRERYYAEVFQTLEHEGEATVADDNATVTIRAVSGTPGAHDGRLLLDGVTLTEQRDGRRRRITAAHAAFSVEPTGRQGHSQTVRLYLTGNVVVTTQDDEHKVVRKTRERLAGIAIPERVVDQVRAIPDARLLDAASNIARRPASMELRDKAITACGRFVRDVTAEIHSRLAFSVSAFVLVLLGAALGVVFRGAHVLVAFGISFLPSLFVIVMNIMGRQLAEKTSTAALGLCAIWGAIVLVGLLDAWIMMRVVRR